MQIYNFFAIRRTISHKKFDLFYYLLLFALRIFSSITAFLLVYEALAGHFLGLL